MNDQARRILISTAAALGLSVVLLLVAILPAEFGWDPTGLGARWGLTGFSATAPGSLRTQDSSPVEDRILFTLAPFESVEYKYRMEAGDTLLFTWQAQAELVYDMHAQPDGAADSYADSFATGRTAAASGSYRAAYPGLHGWFWQNRGSEDVTVTLETQGFYEAAVEFRDGREHSRALHP